VIPGGESTGQSGRAHDPESGSHPATLLTNLRTLGINGEGAAALPAVKGYDDATGLGSPSRYIQSFR
jgi:hypothetical protein